MQLSIPLDKISHNPWQTRQGEPDPEYIKELADDIAANSMLQIPIGRALIDGVQAAVSEETVQSETGLVVQLAFGHNRLAAYRHNFNEKGAGWGRLPVEIRKLTDEQMAVLAWSENEKRRDHTPYERALAIQKRMADFSWSQAQIAEHLGISRPAVSNALRLLKLPEGVLAALGSGAISERVAMSLAGLFDLPVSLREKADRNYSMEPSRIVREALAGSLTSDMVREKVDRICSTFGMKLEEAIFSLDEVFFIPDIQAQACRDCELRFKERNLCLDTECFARKTNSSKAAYLEKASQACGIPVIESQDANLYDVTPFSKWRNGDKLPAILAAHCPNLRLLYNNRDRQRDNDGYSRVEGFEDAIIVCGKKEQFCTCLKGLEQLAAQRRTVAGKNGQPAAAEISAEEDGREPPGDELQAVEPSAEAFAPNAEELKELSREARREKRAAQQEANAIVLDVGERIATGLVMKNAATWRKVAGAVHYGVTGATVWDIQAAIGKDLAEHALPYEIKRLDDVTFSMNRLLKECGLEPLGVESPERSLEQSARLAEERNELPRGIRLVDVFDEGGK